jgi:serine/threonine protein kinase
MFFPTLSDYNAAVLSPETAFADKELSRGRAALGGWGMPHVLSGGFALTYRIHCPGRKCFAVRCFQEDRQGRNDRYRMIVSRLDEKKTEAGSDCWLKTNFLERGIRIDGTWFPIVKMDWAEGKTLGGFIEEKHDNPSAMRTLRRRMRDLASYIEDKNIAHGDIQNGNVIRTGDGLKLIDYDGMFVPGMEEMKGDETGHPNFQHPGRTTGDFHSRIDRFSFIIYELSLHALELDRTLFHRFSTGENILFSRSDLLDPDFSEVFQALTGISDIKKKAEFLKSICRMPVDAVPALEDYIRLKKAVKIPELPAAVAAEGAAEAMEQAVVLPPAGKKPSGKYMGPYPVFAAEDYTGLLRASGRKVEVVGRVEEVKHGVTQHERPYVFLNFGHWRENILQITIWDEGLENFPRKPDSSLVGSWLSVTGLLDQPYRSERLNYTHVSITVHDPSQVRAIKRGEAAFRLDKGFPDTAPETVQDGKESLSNRELLRKLEPSSIYPAVRRTGKRRRRVYTGRQAPKGFTPSRSFLWFFLRILMSLTLLAVLYLFLKIFLK